MNLSRVDTLLSKLAMHKHELDTIAFGDEISDFTVGELESLSANLDRVVQYRPLVVPGRLPTVLRASNQPLLNCYID